jgi:hypothetical protein
MAIDQYDIPYAAYSNGLRVADGVATRVQTRFPIIGERRRVHHENPSWRKEVALGQNATTLFNARERLLKRVPVVAHCEVDGKKKNPAFQNVTYDYWGDTEDWGIPLYAHVGIPADVATAADIQARERFLADYRQARTAFMSGVFLGELAETVRMIKSPASALREGVVRYHRDVKKRLRRVRALPQYRKIVGETWLEYAFGWRPFIRDVADACRIASASPDSYRQTINASKTIEWNDIQKTVTRNPGSTINLPFWKEFYQQQTKVKVRYKGAVDARIKPPSFPEQLGLSWSNVLPTAWELIPYSFLVDYFSNVGKVIEGISTGTILLAWGCRTYRATRIMQMQSSVDLGACQAAVGHQFVRARVYGAGETGQSRHIDRSPVFAVSLGLRDLRLQVPGAGLKWLNIAALANLRFR